MPNVEKNFYSMINDTKFLCKKTYYGFYNPLYKYTIELLYDGYTIPDSYIIAKNKVLYAYPRVYKYIVKRDDLTLIKKLFKINDSFMSANMQIIVRTAAQVGNIRILEWMIKKRYGLKEYLASYAAKGGQMETLKWLLVQGFAVGDLAAAYAAGRGHMDILIYLIRIQQVRNVSAWYAAINGRIDAIKYLYSLDKTSLIGTGNAAAKRGHLDILKFIYEKGSKISYGFVCKHLHILNWLIDNNHIQPNATISEMVAKTGSLECLQLLHANKFPIFTNIVFVNAILGENINMIEWLLCNNCPHNRHLFVQRYDHRSIKNVATSLPILKLLIKSGYVFDNELCNYVAQYGNLEVLSYLYANDFKLDKDVIRSAARAGHLHIIVWAREHGCEWDAGTCIETVNGNHIDVLRWLRGFDRKTCGLPSNETEICPWDERLCQLAFEQNRKIILEFALENGCDIRSNYQ
jgi:hypothetical protein